MALTVAALGSIAITAPAAADEIEEDRVVRSACYTIVETDEVECFDSLSEFKQTFAAEMGSLVTSKKKIKNLASTKKTVTAYATAATTYYTLAKIWDEKSYSGDVMFIVTSKSAMCGNDNVYRSNLPSNWNDRAKSMKAYQGCRWKVWEYYDYGGDSMGWYTGASSLLDLNGKVSSYKIKD